MLWVAPTEKDTANEMLEKHPWAAAVGVRMPLRCIIINTITVL
jgi:hypothetical protein